MTADFFFSCCVANPGTVGSSTDDHGNTYYLRFDTNPERPKVTLSVANETATSDGQEIVAVVRDRVKDISVGKGDRERFFELVVEIIPPHGNVLPAGHDGYETPRAEQAK